MHALVSLSELSVFLACLCCQSLSVICSVHIQGENSMSGVPVGKGEKGDRGDPVRIFLQ